MNTFQYSVANERENLKGSKYYSDQNSGFHGKENEMSSAHLLHCHFKCNYHIWEESVASCAFAPPSRHTYKHVLHKTVHYKTSL